ncbi:hypothetical protein [Streptomyces sp. NPDC093589]|uniref:hypothetical protein n=1 Tax=Streptomyces sp. NPDC093589 TaxID=3366043 RepID=UPI00382C9EC6
MPLIVLLGIVVFPAVWPGWEHLPIVWPLIAPFIAPLVLPLVNVLAALSKRSYLRYVRVRTV